MADAPVIALAGGAGNLGHRIAEALAEDGAQVRALVRPGSRPEALQRLEARGAQLAVVDFQDVDAMAEACRGAACVVSALNGLRPVIVDAQTVLLEGAVKAGVARFIPSDFASDYTKLQPGLNRNFDLRREFKARLDRAPIRATSILNGGFADMLTGQAPLVIFPLRRVLYWESADQLMDFTTMEDTARYTAKAALDPEAPRILRIAGDQVSARDLAAAAGEVTGHPFKLVRLGGLDRLLTLIAFTRKTFPQPDQVFSVWQGLQYVHTLFSGYAKLEPLDNDRYPGLRWTSVKEVLARR